LQILVFRCFSGHGEKTISILVELHSKRKEDSFLCMKDIRSINVELAANQDMFFPFLCMSGRHVTWENTFSTPNSGEHSTHHLAAPYSSCSSCKRQQPPSSLHHTASSPLTEKQHGLHHSAPDSSRQTCWTAAAWSSQFPKAGQHLQHTFVQQLLLTTTPPAAVGQLLDNSFSSCSFWQHLQGAGPLLDSSMGCTCPPHQQHLQGSSMGRHSTAGTAPILSFPQAGSKENKRGEKRGSSESIIGQKLSVDSKGMEGFSTPNSQRLSIHS
jgi:hypothetical protein